jgi:hypothetical protein
MQIKKRPLTTVPSANLYDHSKENKNKVHEKVADIFIKGKSVQNLIRAERKDDQFYTTDWRCTFSF